MQIERDIDITQYTTLKLPAKASFFCIVKTNDDVISAFDFATQNNRAWFVLGGGSNIVIRNLENILVIKNEIQGIENIDDARFSVGAGEVWDDFVAYTTSRGFYCLAPLSFIPGTVGGAPVQNIGAYGEEVGKYIESVEVFDTTMRLTRVLTKEDCNFRYRESLFKDSPHTFIILKVVFDLSSSVASVPDYPGVRERISSEHPNPEDIRRVIIDVRMSKLPDWNKEYNVGSFFKNPEIDQARAEKIRQDFPNLKYFETSNSKVKIPAGWLIEEAGLKGFKKGNFSTYEKHALVIVHNGQGSYEELLNFKKHIVDSVQEKFGILLEQEPVEL